MNSRNKPGLYSVVAGLAMGIYLPVAIAVFFFGFVLGDSPCVSCWAQRIDMMLIGGLCLFILRYGFRRKYVGLIILMSIYGVYISTRHTGFHWAEDVGQGFSVEMWGAHTYTWAVFIFWCAVFASGALVLMGKEEDEDFTREFRPTDKVAAYLILLVTLANALQALINVGPPPYMGLGDPVRGSLNPRYFAWSTEHWEWNSIRLKGRSAVEPPDLSGKKVSSSLDQRSVVTVSRLTKTGEKRIDVPLKGRVMDMVYGNGQYALVTDKFGVYVLNDNLDKVDRHTVVDPYFSVDVKPFVGVCFDDQNQIMAIGYNKTYVLLKKGESMDDVKNFKFFTESLTDFDEVKRGRFSTVRAKMYYIHSLAFNPADSMFYTVTVPNNFGKDIVVSAFSSDDYTLSSEFKVGKTSLKLREGKFLDGLYVVSAKIKDGKLYLLDQSAVVDEVDIASKQITAVYELEGVTEPVALVFRGNDFMVLQKDGALAEFKSP